MGRRRKVSYDDLTREYWRLSRLGLSDRSIREKLGIAGVTLALIKNQKGKHDNGSLRCIYSNSCFECPLNDCALAVNISFNFNQLELDQDESWGKGHEEKW